MKRIPLFEEVKVWDRGPVLNYDESCAQCYKPRDKGTKVYWNDNITIWFCSNKCCNKWHHID